MHSISGRGGSGTSIYSIIQLMRSVLLRLGTMITQLNYVFKENSKIMYLDSETCVNYI